jgi:hypothetical protein
VPGAQPGIRAFATGRAPAWALKLASAIATFAIFTSSFGWTATHTYAANAPLQPSVTASDTAATPSTASPTSSRPTSTLSPQVRTTTRDPITTTRSS